MAGEDQEQLADYLQLEYYIEELQAGRPAHLPRELSPTKAHVYRLVTLFRSASSGAGQPRPAFAASLRARLEQELWPPTRPQLLPPSLAREPSSSPRKQRSTVSRRALLTGGAAAAASLVVGTGLGTTTEHVTQPPASGSSPAAMGAGAMSQPWPRLLLPEGEGSWMAVAKLADLGDEALRFTTESIVGYLIHSDGDQGEKPGVIAISAACSHMGCIVQWQKTDRKYHCPCHGGLFSEYGKTDTTSPLNYLTALPRLETRITRHGTAEFIEVRVPTRPEAT